MSRLANNDLNPPNSWDGIDWTYLLLFKKKKKKENQCLICDQSLVTEHPGEHCWEQFEQEHLLPYEYGLNWKWKCSSYPIFINLP